jgi:hypothetical protein
MEVLNLDRCTFLTCNFQPQYPADFLRGPLARVVVAAGLGDGGSVPAQAAQDPGQDVAGAFIAVMGEDEETGASALQYHRSPPGLTRPQVVDWSLSKRAAVRAGGVQDVYHTLYHLASHSLQVVERDPAWFEEEALPALEAAWSRLSAQLAARDAP